MQEICQILVPLDFSMNTIKLVDYASYIAGKFSAKLCFVHVVDTRQAYDLFLSHPVLTDLQEKIMAAAEERMASFLRANADRCKGCTGKVINGNIVDSLIAYAKNEKVDLIIIGTHGSKGLEKILLGSVAERVIKKSPCPTLLYNPYM
ncbi:MAG: universal stress protein [Proteobacteria bacterium]|nr:universal stress protein [Pseudomonadota bacterium]MBU1060781.1 universal stress protein [Pseudomonadota bacterium]